MVKKRYFVAKIKMSKFFYFGMRSRMSWLACPLHLKSKSFQQEERGDLNKQKTHSLATTGLLLKKHTTSLRRETQ